MLMLKLELPGTTLVSMWGPVLGEARAGPFAVRAGLKFGVGVRNGVAEVDIGPVTVPTGLFILPPMLGP